MRVFSLQAGQVRELSELPTALPQAGTLWVSYARQDFEQRLPELQASLQRLCGLQLLDLHVSDLLNAQLPSRFDYTSEYELLVFRRLATRQPGHPDATPDASARKTLATRTTRGLRRSTAHILKQVDTSPVGFALLDRLLLSVHPADCAVRDTYVQRLLQSARASDARSPSSRVPASAADLMLRIINQMVDGFLELRRELTRQLDHWQADLLNPRTRFNNWPALLEARLALHQLDEVCEDQRVAVQDWMEALTNRPVAADPGAQRERDLLEVRSRDVLEHIERVVHHVQRLEHGVETAVQMHFSAQGHRANEIMRTLTVLTAIFLPLNLIAGIFGMNFDFIPLVHSHSGFWWAMASMGLIALALALLFWRKRYLERSGR